MLHEAAAALLQEPYVGGGKSMKNYDGVRIFQSTNTDGDTIATIAVYDKELDIIQCPKLTTRHITVVKIRTSAWIITIVSYYFEPDTLIEPYLEQLKQIAAEAGLSRLIIGGDAIAKSTWLGSSKVDLRREQMAGGLEEMNLPVLNDDDTPTFDTIRGNKRYHSHVDVTACSEDLIDVIDDWRVEQGLTSSDHNRIKWKIRLQR